MKTKINIKMTLTNNSNELQIFADVQSTECKALIERVIAKNGFASEHNYDYFVSYTSKKMTPFFIYFGEDKGLFSIKWDDNSYQIISEIMAPVNERCELALLFVNYVFKNADTKKVFVEFPLSLRKELLKAISNENKLSKPQSNSEKSNIVIGNILHHLYTPIIELSQWDTELVGSDFSKLRKAKNRFFRNFKVELLKGDEILSVPVSDFEKLVGDWKKNRKCNDTAYYEDYLNFFRNKFNGSACHIALKLNGVLCAVAAAWSVPNTDNECVYYAINLHNYTVSELGDFLTVLFLDELKLRGFKYLDFGSSDEKLLAYKKKFKPVSQYEVVCFYIRKNK